MCDREGEAGRRASQALIGYSSDSGGGGGGGGGTRGICVADADAAIAANVASAER